MLVLIGGVCGGVSGAAMSACGDISDVREFASCERTVVGTFIGNRAVVLGASVAGLLAGRLLAESYREVVLVDRDRLEGIPGAAGARRSAPQGRHAHGLLARGQQVLEELFPG
jgi:hypothetical protein